MSLVRVKLSTAIAEFMNTDDMNKKSPTTQANYRRVFEAFRRILGTRVNAYELSVKDIEDVIRDIRKGAGPEERADRIARGLDPRRGRSDQSLNNDRAIIRKFVAFLEDYDYISKNRNICRNLKNVTVTGGQFAIENATLTDEQAGDMLEVAGRYHPRDRAAIALGLYAGMRESEIRDLTWGNINWDGLTITYFRRKQQKKRNAWHTVDISPELLGELTEWRKWIQKRHGVALHRDWFVIPARVHNPGGPAMRTGQTMNPDWPIIPDRQCSDFGRYMKGFFRKIGAEGIWRAGTHTLRRTAAVRMRDRANGDMTVVQEFLGHSSVTTSETYTRHNPQRAKVREVVRGGLVSRPTDSAQGNVIDLASRRRLA